MPYTTSSQPPLRIDECPDLMTDGYVGDEGSNLAFLSVWVRDTVIRQFLARLTLGRDDDGLDRFHLITDAGGSAPVFVGNVDSLEMRSTRLFRRTLFGSTVIDQHCVKPYKANASVLILRLGVRH
ncbi:hypothetical protein [Serratia ficaria]|nr:Uncharacterised protein [Serratia ficaria]CAI1253919.1 Uncharacterised protein [Serratia ficaria]CAI2032689.1 Uncharacterised protein [Serratia ficaria]CAI2538632.1 Uncharacterised protein [Serratia ficaria]CAI2539144.1 Uncharacterised protein [Serratia ficaria]